LSSQHLEDIGEELSQLKAYVMTFTWLHKEWHERCQRYKDYNMAKYYQQRSPILALYL